MLLRLLGLLLVVWIVVTVVVTVVGWVVEGLFWLAVVGLLLVLLTGALGVRERIRR